MVVGFLDADVILRYLTREPETLYRKAVDLLEHCESSGDRLIVSEITVAEVVWVLHSFYKFDRTVITPTLLAFFELTPVHVPDKPLLQQALFLFRDLNLKFGDALLSARALRESPSVVYAFDSHFGRVPGLEHRVPS